MSGINKLTPTTLQGKISSTTISGGELITQPAPITKIPQSLSQLQKALILRGEVQQQNNDGTTRIKTPRGSIDIKLDNPPAKGQKIDIQIPAGSPPREAVIQRPAPTPQPTTPGQPNQPARPAPSTPAPSMPTPETPQQTRPTQPAPAPTTPGQPSQPSQAAPTPQTPPPPLPPLGDANGFRQTAQQAADKIADAARHSVDPTQIGNRNPSPQRILQTGQTIRITALPPALQNPSGLAQLPTAPVLQPTSTTTLPQMMMQTLSGNMSAAQLGTPLTMPAFPANGAPLPINGLGTGLNAPSTAPFSGTLLQTILQNNLSPAISMGDRTIQTAPQNITVPGMTPTGGDTALNGLRDANITAMRFPSLNTHANGAGLATITSITQPSSPLQTVQAGQWLTLATGHITSQGNPIVQLMTPTMMAGASAQTFFFALNYPASNLPAGTQIIMQPTAQTTNTPMPAGTQTALNTSWPALEDIFELLFTQSSAAQAQSLLNTLPRPAAAGHQFTAAALLFIAAARGGDINGWLGGRADQILKNVGTADKKDSLNRLLGDLGRLSGRASASDPQAPAATQGSTDWRGYTLPLLFGMDLSKINLWTKPFGDDDGNNSDPDKISGTRFIVDLTLSRMGNIQLDGLVQPYAKRLDLALKTQQDIAPAMRQKLREIWHNALTQIDMSGHIDFQTA